jgi:ABC-type proline/glycine betaine transport system permease subunit
VAAKGLGEVIIAGLQSNNVAFVLQGGLVVALLAVLIHDGEWEWVKGRLPDGWAAPWTRSHDAA